MNTLYQNIRLQIVNNSYSFYSKSLLILQIFSKVSFSAKIFDLKKLSDIIFFETLFTICLFVFKVPEEVVNIVAIICLEVATCVSAIPDMLLIQKIPKNVLMSMNARHLDIIVHKFAPIWMEGMEHIFVLAVMVLNWVINLVGFAELSKVWYLQFKPISK